MNNLLLAEAEKAILTLQAALSKECEKNRELQKELVELGDEYQKYQEMIEREVGTL